MCEGEKLNAPKTISIALLFELSYIEFKVLMIDSAARPVLFKIFFFYEMQNAHCSRVSPLLFLFRAPGVFISCHFAAMLTSPSAGLQNAIGPVGSGQNAAPALNAPAPIDPSSMQRAYAALGLPYSNQSPAQTQTPPAQPAQTQHQQQMRPLNALGNPTQTHAVIVQDGKTVISVT